MRYDGGSLSVEVRAIDTVIQIVQGYAERLPLELFVLIGAFVEEAISPIPAFVVMIPAGATAQVQGHGWWYLPVLAVIGAVGRLFASLLLYVLADKGEDLLFGHGRRFFGISHQQMERYGARLGSSRRDWLGLFLLNAIPAVPTSLLSLACGFIKLPLRVFLTATFFGAIIHAFIYLVIGYAGLRAVSALQNLEVAGRIIAILVIAALLAWLLQYYRKRRQKQSR